jgi:5-methylcytosine-specific restriction protein A
MPPRPTQPCKTPGCPGKARPGKPTCPDCRTRSNRDLRQRRGHSTAQGYGHAHRTRFRPGVLKRDRICRICKKAEAEEADHWPLDRKTLVAMGLDPNDPSHGRGLCHSCHSSETARYQPGGWYRHAPW